MGCGGWDDWDDWWQDECRGCVLSSFKDTEVAECHYLGAADRTRASTPPLDLHCPRIKEPTVSAPHAQGMTSVGITAAETQVSLSQRLMTDRAEILGGT